MEAGNSPGGGGGAVNQCGGRDAGRREQLDTTGRYELEWTCLARAAAYGCAGCTLDNSLHRSMNLFICYTNFPADGSRVS